MIHHFLQLATKPLLKPLLLIPQTILSTFFLLTTLLGYTHFARGPVKPKWMQREIDTSNLPAMSRAAQLLTTSFAGHNLQELVAQLDTDSNYTQFWQAKSTAWTDALFLLHRDSSACALTSIYCLHVYATSSSFIHSNMSTINIYRNLQDCIKQCDELPGLLSLVVIAIESNI